MDVTVMIFETLRGMAIGIPGVFAVLAVFYATVKLLMMNMPKTKGKNNKDQ